MILIDFTLILYLLKTINKVSRIADLHSNGLEYIELLVFSGIIRGVSFDLTKQVCLHWYYEHEHTLSFVILSESDSGDRSA